MPPHDAIALPVATRPAMVDALSCERHSEHAASEVAESLAAGFAQRGLRSTPDLLIVFVSQHHSRALPEIERTLCARLAPRHVLAVAGEGVISGNTEVEASAGIAVLGCVLPGVTVTTFSSDDLPMSFGLEEPAGASGGDGDGLSVNSDLAGVARTVGIVPGHRCTILLADPFTTPIGPVLGTLARARALASPGTGEHRRGVIAGGLASASGRPGGNTMLVDGKLLSSGFVGVSLGGNIRADSVVSQGCRPIGENMVVTSSRGQFIRTLGGRPAMDVLHELIEASSEGDRKQISTGLLLGRVINEYKDHFGRSDYLLRGVVGVMKQDKAIAIAEPVRVGQTVRFHVRDAATAREDLAMLMDAQAIHDKPIGALLFTCNGRGTRLFPHPHHDASLIQHAFSDPVPGEVRAKAGSAVQAWPRVPLAGFFAAGEIGPIGDEVFLHTQTASAVFFR